MIWLIRPSSKIDNAAVNSEGLNGFVKNAFFSKIDSWSIQSMSVAALLMVQSTQCNNVDEAHLVLQSESAVQRLEMIQ